MLWLEVVDIDEVDDGDGVGVELDNDGGGKLKIFNTEGIASHSSLPTRIACVVVWICVSVLVSVTVAVAVGAVVIVTMMVCT